MSLTLGRLGKHNKDAWVILKGGGKLATKVGNGEQMCGMVPGLGSVRGYPHKTPSQRRRGEYGHKYMQVS